MAIKYIKIFQSKALQNLPKLVFLFWKYQYLLLRRVTRWFWCEICPKYSIINLYCAKVINLTVSVKK
jgi:hypothetical protein